MTRRVGGAVPLALVLALVSGGCWGSASPTPPPSPEAGSPTPGASSSVASLAPSIEPTPSPTVEPSCAERTLAGLTEAQRIGQLFNVGLANNQLSVTEKSQIASHHFGSAWFPLKSTLGVAGIRAVSDAVQAQATKTATGGVRFFIAANQEGGTVQALTGSGFTTIPSAVDQGLVSPDTLRTRATAWGSALAAAGVNFNFAPVADVVPAGSESTNAPIGKLRREYGSDPASVASHVDAFIDGMTAADVATSAKHFPGLGRVIGNTDYTGNVVDNVTTPNDPYLEPFRAAVDDGVPFVMVALATYTKIDSTQIAAFSPIVIGDLLRGRLGFRGVVISDDLGDAVAVAGIPPADRALRFVRAGGDMIISRSFTVAAQMADALAATAAKDPALRERIDDAVLRVLEAKDDFGLLPCSA